MTPRDGPGSISDRISHPLGVERLARAGYLCVRCADRDDYHDGNLLWLERAPAAGSLAGWLEVWRRELGVFPGVRRIQLRWETGDAAQADDALASEVTALGGSLAQHPGLVLGALVEPARPADVAVRELVPGDWPAVLALHREEAVADAHRVFLEWAVAGSRALVAAGRAHFWGAFDRDTLAGAAGLCAEGGHAALCEVATARAFRRRGIAATLCHRALEAHLRRRPADAVVVVAEPGEATRLYQRLGFLPASRVWTFSRAA